MEKYKVHVEDNGTIRWYNEKELQHRLDGPAVELFNGNKFWYQEGKFHRLDGPAKEYVNGDKHWYQEDLCHRLDGPAIEYVSGDKYWYKEEKLHRLDGPAIEWGDGNKSWYINGKEFTEEKFNKQVNTCEGKVVEIDGVKYKLTQV